jgi:neutral ceramidase
VLGAAFAAGTKEGPGAAFCSEGVDANRVLSAVSRTAYRARRGLGDVQSPKAMLLPVGALGWTANRLPIQLVRLGPLVLLALAQEVTIVAGMRLRRAVAEVVDVSPDLVIVQGYANDYAGYLTTPEEYDAQRYEGGHTMFGRWQLPAYTQEIVRVARALREGAPVDFGEPPRPKPPKPARTRLPAGPPRCLAVRTEPGATYAPGDAVTAEFALTDPRATLLPAYAVVEQQQDDAWVRVAADGEWSTTVQWRRGEGDAWHATVTWRVPSEAEGIHRLGYLTGVGQCSTREFTVHSR